MQKQLTEGKLFENGKLKEAGYSTKTVRRYDRADIKGHKWKIKEWDYYIITDGKKAVALTVADNSYMSLVSASFLDFETPCYKTTSEIKFFTFGKVGLPSCPEEGNVAYNSKKAKFTFEKYPDRRELSCIFKNFWDKTDFECRFTLTDFPKEQMTIATPFRKPHAFYYNTKINCMKAAGYCTVKGKRMAFDGANSLGTLDWGRGIWTYKNTWYWASLQTRLDDGRTFGFNLGYGFGDTSAASENMLFLDGVAHKLDKVTFEIPQKHGKDDFLSPWKFYDNEERLELNFVPILDRKDVTDIGIIASRQHQVFGRFSGKAILDDGTEMHIEDKLGFAEKVFNKW
ncbi:MAG: DUF2804 domain-containing protein [Corallococcus sp.]|nr:DUF2804 domain-containing protein [Corallococcus sp.]MCM1359372.1 DUF2804 domain-containing protein [Corallococcus sp.]MCM1394815.1 DUF2804 domain-containing protein [Corallococcus sp.]